MPRPPFLLRNGGHGNAACPRQVRAGSFAAVPPEDHEWWGEDTVQIAGSR
jgi:hypothetical protein